MLFWGVFFCIPLSHTLAQSNSIQLYFHKTFFTFFVDICFKQLLLKSKNFVCCNENIYMHLNEWKREYVSFFKNINWIVFLFVCLFIWWILTCKLNFARRMTIHIFQSTETVIFSHNLSLIQIRKHQFHFGQYIKFNFSILHTHLIFWFSF